jgi:hypothetical protein
MKHGIQLSIKKRVEKCGPEISGHGNERDGCGKPALGDPGGLQDIAERWKCC